MIYVHSNNENLPKGSLGYTLKFHTLKKGELTCDYLMMKNSH